jgi:hypothetical protein
MRDPRRNRNPRRNLSNRQCQVVAAGSGRQARLDWSWSFGRHVSVSGAAGREGGLLAVAIVHGVRRNDAAAQSRQPTTAQPAGASSPPPPPPPLPPRSKEKETANAQYAPPVDGDL